MGAGGSVSKGAASAPVVVEKGATLFQVQINTAELAKRTSSALLEISTYGIRLLNREDKQVIKAVPMSLIHSWQPEEKSIVFVCTNSNMDLYQVELNTGQCREILKALHSIVTSVLNNRKELALNEAEVIDLLASLNRKAGPKASQLDILKGRLDGCYLTSEKAFLVASSFSDTFDKMEATLFLQSHLIDQNKFSRVLESFESEEERQNVWHRVYTKLY